MSRLHELWQSHREQWEKIDALEKKMEESVMRKRRRIANLLDETPSTRQSTLRFFCSHKKISDSEYEFIVEGKLLVGHLDHARAKEIDDALYDGQVNPQVDPTDRSQYRGGIAERESDTPVEPIYFTHLFDKFAATIYTVYQPKTGVTPSKRQKNKRSSPSVEDSLESSSKVTLDWSREAATPEVATSPDSHAFIIPYTCPEPPSSDLRFHSIVLELSMWPRRGDDSLYQPSPPLAKALFPQHKNVKAKRRHIPVLNDAFVPSLLTLSEVVTALFHYIQFHKLQEEHEPSMIKCDKTLQSLFETSRANFADIQFFLTSKQLIVESQQPSEFIYICSEQSQVLTLDMDVHIPSLFHYRCRELLRRIKQREFEYTSSRTKARNWLNGDKVVPLLEECITGQGYTMDHIGNWLALARAATGEARQTAQVDAQICYLLEQAQQHAMAAQSGWELVDTLSKGTISEVDYKVKKSAPNDEEDI